MLSVTVKANTNTGLNLTRGVETNVVSGRLYVGENCAYNPVTVKVTDENGNVVFLEQIYVNNDGYAEFVYVHNTGNAGTGVMTVTAYHNAQLYTATYKIVGEDVVNSIVSAVQTECKKENPDYMVVKNAYLGEDTDVNGIPDNAETLNLDLTVYNTLSNKDNVFVILGNDPANDSVDGIDKAVRAFYDAVALAKLTESGSVDSIKELMGNDLYASIFKKDKVPVNAESESILEAASDNIKTKIYERLLSAKNTTKDGFSNGLLLYTLTESLKYGEWQNISALLKAYNDAGYITLDYSTYNTLANKTSADKAMADKKYNSYKEIENAFSQAALAQKNAENPTTTPRPGTGATGGGGGGGGGYSVSTPLTTPQPITNNMVTSGSTNSEISGTPVFKDMDEAKWATEAVEALYKKGIVNGTNESSFEPNRGITRAEFVKMLVGIVELSPISEDVFNDVTPSDWSYTYAAAAYKAGIVEGDENRNFNGQKIINREEMAAMVHRMIEKLGINPAKLDSIAFDDKDEISSWALESVNYLKSIEVVNGRSKNFFEPKAVLTRAEAAVVIYKVMSKA